MMQTCNNLGKLAKCWQRCLRQPKTYIGLLPVPKEAAEIQERNPNSGELKMIEGAFVLIDQIFLSPTDFIPIGATGTIVQYGDYYIALVFDQFYAALTFWGGLPNTLILDRYDIDPDIIKAISRTVAISSLSTGATPCDKITQNICDTCT